jgi:hypothetical protein
MITNNKGKFTRSINSIELELGGKNGLFGSVNDGAPASANQDSGKSALERRGEAILKGNKAIQGPAQTEQANAQVEAAIISAQAQEYSAEIQASGQKYAADMQYRTEIDKAKEFVKSDVAYQNRKAEEAKLEAEKVKVDPIELDANEIKVVDLVKKYNVLEDPTAFKEMVNSSVDDQVKKDALELEKALKADGKDLTADGSITDKTLLAIKAVIGENSEAIINYQKALDSLKGGAKGENVDTGFNKVSTPTEIVCDDTVCITK